MPQGISPNPLNKISEVYLSQISEHHKKDADGNTIPHEGEEVEEGAGLYANIHAKRKRGGKMRKKGDKGAPSSQDFANAARTAKEEVEVGEAKIIPPREKLKTDRNMFQIPKNEKDAARERLLAKAQAKRDKMDEAMAMRPSNMKKKAKLNSALKRLEDMKVASKMKEEVEDTEEGIQYGIFKGDGKPKGAMAAFGKKEKAKKDKKIKMEALSNWKEDYVWEADEEKMEKEIKEKKIKNKITINPKLGEAVEELGGQLLDVQEMSGAQGAKEDDPQLKSKMLRQRQLKKQVLLRKLQAVRQTGGEDIVASYEPEGEQLDEYGNPRVGARLRVARAIDRVNPNPKMGSKRTAISNKLKMSAIKAETKRREQKENPYSAGKKVRMALGMSNEDYIPEEGYDIARDMGKIPPTKDKKDATTLPRKSEPMKGMTAAQKAAKGKSALDIVKADIRKKYGKDAIMDVGKK